MATTRNTTSTPLAAMSVEQQIAHYRATARALRGTPAGVKPKTSFAITAGKTVAASRNFFTIAADVYASERAPFLD